MRVLSILPSDQSSPSSLSFFSLLSITCILLTISTHAAGPPLIGSFTSKTSQLAHEDAKTKGNLDQVPWNEQPIPNDTNSTSNISIPDLPLGHTRPQPEQTPLSPPEGPLDTGIMKEYRREKKSIQWLAAQLELPSFVENHLGLSRSLAVHDLPETLVSVLQVTHPKALRELLRAQDLARDIKAYLTQLQIHYASAVQHIPTMADIFLTPKDRSQIWNHASNVAWLLIWSSGPISYIGQPIKMILDLKAFTGKPSGPTSATTSALGDWAYGQMDLAIDAFYTAYKTVFTEGQPGQLRNLTAQFQAGHLTLDPKAFLHEFKVSFAQRLCNGNPAVTNFKCTGPDCHDGYVTPPVKEMEKEDEGEELEGQSSSFNATEASTRSTSSSHSTDSLTGDAMWKSNLPSPALDYLHSLGVNWDSFFLGNDGWAISTATYTCKRSCKFWKKWGLHRKVSPGQKKNRSPCDVYCDGPRAWRY
ncbi:MAG: hypothetical protein DHS80DRAFT_21406 [Piptocephalis tieghemiana]|nr:MAG: hypothetical protein DHS80DRAFT_21406 [Piptocephalis tieghemiana]